MSAQDEKAPHADLHCMLLANLGKSPALRNLLTLRRPPAPSISSSSLALDQLLDRFVRAPDDDASSKVRASTSSYDYLAYLFADLSEVGTFPRADPRSPMMRSPPTDTIRAA